MKVCSKCNLELDDSLFWEKDSACKKCRNKRRYELRRKSRIEKGLKVKFPTSVAKSLLKQSKKYCPGCTEILDLSQFSTMKVRSGIASHCRKCSKKLSKAINGTEEAKQKRHQKYENNKERCKNNKLRRKFGITYEQYKRLLLKQNNGCAICGRTPEENGKCLAVDHCHKTNEIRSLLCSSCNLCIGFIEKNNIPINKIINYLKNGKE
jgi:hypothetical protein